MSLDFYYILICFIIIDVFSKHAWVFPLKDKKGITITKTSQEISNETRYRPNLWVDKVSEFYNRSMKSWLQGKWCSNVFNAKRKKIRCC